MRTHQVQHPPLTLTLAHTLERPRQRPTSAYPPLPRTNEPRQHPPHLTSTRTQPPQVQPRTNNQRTRAHTRRIEQLQAFPYPQLEHPRTLDACPLPRIQPAAHPTLRRPQPPRNRDTRQPLRTPPRRKPIQKRVPRRIRTLPRRTNHTRSRREQHKLPHTQTLRQLMQIPSPIDLRSQHPTNTLSSQRLNHTIIKHTSRMHHHLQPPTHTPKQHLQRITITHITRLDPHPRTQPHKLPLQLTHTIRRTPPTTNQQQITRTTLRHQMPRYQRTQPTRTTRNQHHTLANHTIVPRHIHTIYPTNKRPAQLRTRLHTHPHQPRNEQLTTTHSHLIHSQPHRARNLAPHIPLTIHINQHKPAGMLRLCRPHQPPHPAASQIRDTLTSHVHRSHRHNHQARLHRPLIRKPPLQLTQRTTHNLGDTLTTTGSPIGAHTTPHSPPRPPHTHIPNLATPTDLNHPRAHPNPINTKQRIPQTNPPTHTPNQRLTQRQRTNRHNQPTHLIHRNH